MHIDLGAEFKLTHRKSLRTRMRRTIAKTGVGSAKTHASHNPGWVKQIAFSSLGIVKTALSVPFTRLQRL